MSYIWVKAGLIIWGNRGFIALATISVNKTAEQLIPLSFNALPTTFV